MNALSAYKSIKLGFKFATWTFDGNVSYLEGKYNSKIFWTSALLNLRLC